MIDPVAIAAAAAEVTIGNREARAAATWSPLGPDTTAVGIAIATERWTVDHTTRGNAATRVIGTKRILASCEGISLWVNLQTPGEETLGLYYSMWQDSSRSVLVLEVIR